MTRPLNLSSVEPLPVASVTDQVFDVLYNGIVESELPPGMRLSEVEVARQMNISRQPVRDAFYRLSQLGFLLVRPQRATTVTPISAKAVLEARFIRTAIEVETIELATERATDEDIAALHDLIDRQKAAIGKGDKILFHQLDDEFHRKICEIAGAEFAWAMIRDKKAHMDRARYLSLAFGAQSAMDDHLAILDAIKARDAQASRERMRTHLSRIVDILNQIRSEKGQSVVSDAD